MDTKKGRRAASTFVLKVFGCGYFSAIALSNLIEDWYGKEDYLELIANSTWIPSQYSVPISIGIIVLCLMVYENSLKKAQLLISMFHDAALFILTSKEGKP